jgi:hypothetical protein
MESNLEAGGIPIVCSSPVWTQRMIDGGARLIERSRAEGFRQALTNDPVSGHS